MNELGSTNHHPHLGTSTVVLHVIESFGAGSAGAMQEFVDATPDMTHHLLRAVRRGEYVESDTSPLFAQVQDLPRGTLDRLRAIRSVAAKLQPDVIHAHSSLAGLYVRLALRSRRRRRIIYSPHCFAFERRDLGRAVRTLIAVVEAVLALNTDRIAACSERERRLADRMPTHRRAIHVPNTPRSIGRVVSPERHDDRFTVVGLGRIGPQKDPARFAESIRAMRSGSPDVRAIWIGDGDPALRVELEASGVQVTGWVSGAEVAQTIARGDLYLHTAAWEGFPLAVLEAVQLGRPVIARRIGAFEGMPREWLFDKPADAADAADAVRLEPMRNISAWRHALRDNTPTRQRESLLRLYAAPTRRQIGA